MHTGSALALLAFAAFFGACIRGFRLARLIHRQALATLEALPEDTPRAERDAWRDRVVRAAEYGQRVWFILAGGLMVLAFCVGLFG